LLVEVGIFRNRLKVIISVAVKHCQKKEQLLRLRSRILLLLIEISQGITNNVDRYLSYILSNVKYDQYLKFKIEAAADKNKILFDLFNQHSFPSLKKTPELVKKSVESWTGLSAFLNPYFSFNVTDHNEVL